VVDEETERETRGQKMADALTKLAESGAFSGVEDPVAWQREMRRRHPLSPTQTQAPMKQDRDIEKTYPISQFVDKLRRLADALEAGERFEIQIAGERIYVPKRATYNIEHERDEEMEEIEFQITWER
jgi:amphi-Trp domain-containing protein